MDYMEKRNVKRILKGLNEEIRWAKREILRSRSNVEKQSSLQRYVYLLSLKARECHLKLAFMNGTPYSAAERNVRKALPSFADEERWDLHTWACEEKLETYVDSTEYAYSLAG
jgi:hypothetical protein